MNTKNVLCGALLVTAILAAQTRRQPNIEDWDLRCEPDSAEIMTGQPIHVRAVLSYGGKENTFRYANTFGFFRWKVDRVTSQSATVPVAQTPFARNEWDLHRNFGTKGGLTQPGFKTEQILDVAKYFEMSEPGEYDITVSARVDGGAANEKGKARSQTFRVKVLRP